MANSGGRPFGILVYTRICTPFQYRGAHHGYHIENGDPIDLEQALIYII